jgi:hypothetical protein
VTSTDLETFFGGNEAVVVGKLERPETTRNRFN